MVRFARGICLSVYSLYMNFFSQRRIARGERVAPGHARLRGGDRASEREQGNGRVDQVEDDRSAALDNATAAAALRWWVSAGVADAVGETPRNRFAEEVGAIGEAAAPAPAVPAPGRLQSRAAAGPSVSPNGAEAAARALAAATTDLESLRANLERFEGCALRKTATQLVFADGTPGSRVMLVGEAPGGDEDRIGRPFVGRAGQLLDRMLHAIGLNRERVYIANVVPWRPPGNRTPTPQETQACLPFIRRQIELARPEILVCLGASAAQTLLGVREGITRARGNWYPYESEDGRILRAIAMFHPAYLLRQPAQKRQAWIDMRALARALET
jgi:uracil-DNA glycosylase